MNTSALVQKLWNYCNVLRDDGMSYGDYVEQLTYLLFLKMADARTHHTTSDRSYGTRLRADDRRVYQGYPAVPSARLFQ
ncbi:MAG: type I restriction-modification system subunit M N-terminal domain-containing protein [Betaproteobacteria bacterium]|nr:type I restriction-modification system subunit M N-terminal domain-containing protein [Betaproteobacteria bacterium]